MGGLPARVRSKLFQQLVRVRARAGGEALERLGSDYGGWWMPARLVQDGRVAICAGVGEDTTFDEALAARGVQVVAVDPTPRAIAHMEARFAARPELEEQVRFVPVGMWSQDTTMRFFEPSNPAHVSHSLVNLHGTDGGFEAACWTLGTLLDHCGLEHVDILKLDIEGAEFAVLEDLLGTALRPEVVAVEIDAPFPARRTLALLRSMRGAGYDLLHAERWNLVFRRPAPARA